MKYIYLIFFIGGCLIYFGCGNTSKTTVKKTVEPIITINKPKDTIYISNQNNFELVLYDWGFYKWLESQPKQDEFYESSLELKNFEYIEEWNRRVANPSVFDQNLYQKSIDYQINPNHKYGLEVNYLLYQYFSYFELTHEIILKS